jgi:uncharacterized protein (DUF697 family)
MEVVAVKKGDSQGNTATGDAATVVAEPVTEETSEAPKESGRAAKAEAARAQAVQFMADKQFALARKALEEAEALEAEPVAEKQTGPRKVLAALRWRLNRKSDGAQGEGPEAEEHVVLSSTAAVDKAVKIVDLYSKMAAVVGLLPGNILNFAAILAVMVTMVWRIATTFGHRDGKNRIRGSIMALIGAVIPTGIGHGIAAMVIAIPAMIAGSVLYFLVTPVLAYALTKAVGNTFVMHFESGGTLLNFDPKGFQEYFLKEFQEAGGQFKAA